MRKSRFSPASVLARLNERQHASLLLLGFWLLLLVLAALRPLAVPDEGRYGEVGRWMLISSDWLTPRLNGLPFFHKPPWLYWLEAISMAGFGVNEWALRLVPALHAGVLLVALYLAARRLSSAVVARRSVVMLGSSLGFLVGGQYVNHDMLVASWISLAIWSFALALMTPERPNAALARLGFLACALGVLSKGLIGIVLPALVLGLWLIWTRQLKKLLYLPWISGLALFAVLALPWFIRVQQNYPLFFKYMFIDQQFTRYTAASYNNPQPWWFYLLALVLLLFPWVFFAFGQLRRQHRQATQAAISPDGWRLCWVWLGAILLFFSIPHSKLIGYILPVLPPLALLAALGWQRSVAPKVWASRAFAALCGLNLALALLLLLWVGEVTRSSRTQDVAAVLACAAAPDERVWVADAYPYDLPFYRQSRQAMVVLGDWPRLREHSGDGWQRELFEGADFDPVAAQALQAPAQLAQAAERPGTWFVIPHASAPSWPLSAWELYFKGAGWDLYRSVGAVLAPKSPESAKCKGLPGGKHQGDK